MAIRKALWGMAYPQLIGGGKYARPSHCCDAAFAYLGWVSFGANQHV